MLSVLTAIPLFAVYKSASHLEISLLSSIYSCAIMSTEQTIEQNDKKVVFTSAKKRLPLLRNCILNQLEILRWIIFL